jgi:tetratricopeptide (TPR) repeat protein
MPVRSSTFAAARLSLLWLLPQLLLSVAACRKEDAQAHLERAKVAQFDGKPDVALAEFKLALDLAERDSSPEAMVYRARALRGAADVYALSLRDFKHAVEVYRELAQRCPEAPETLEGRIQLATLLRHEFHDTRGAIAELTAALARNPLQSAELSYQVAEMYFELQNYEQCALEAARVAQKFESSTYADDALFLRAQALGMLDERNADAQRAFFELIDRFPDSELAPHALFEVGRLRAMTGDFEHAIEIWVTSLKTHPEPAMVQTNIAKARNRLRSTTPVKVGDATSAFDRDRRPVFEKKKTNPRTSAEAVGGTPEEAEQEAKMPAEAAHAPEADKGQGEGGL